MAYSELIKNFGRIRDYMREFYVCGFRSRSEFDKKSGRTYDNERRRIESYLGNYMAFRQGDNGKNFFLSVDSRETASNPLYEVWKSKSFTDGDITLHFFILDLLWDGTAALSSENICRRIDSDYLGRFSSPVLYDESTVRKKLAEYVRLGLLCRQKQGRTVLYRRTAGHLPAEWAAAAAFFAEAAPLGVIGSYLLDLLPAAPEFFCFKHHYITQTLDSGILFALLECLHRKNAAGLVLKSRGADSAPCPLVPLSFFISVQNGRQYVLGYHLRQHRIFSCRLDLVESVQPLGRCEEFDACRQKLDALRPFLWGVGCGRPGAAPESVSFTVRLGPGEEYIFRRLEREKRCGQVERPDAETCRFTAQVTDTMELVPWLRTFLCRIVQLDCSNRTVENLFRADAEAMYRLYGLAESPSTVPPPSCGTPYPAPGQKRRNDGLLPFSSNSAEAAPLPRAAEDAGGGLFHELYGRYYTAVAAILSAAAAGELTPALLEKLAREKAFSESFLSILPALKSGRWPLVHADMTTPLAHAPTRPLTTLEKRWLKALLADRRAALFGLSADGLEDVEPLFSPADFVLFDQYSDGDPYDTPEYIAHFRTILEALGTHHRLLIQYRAQNDRQIAFRCTPVRLEFSEKDDKFRLLTTSRRTHRFVNLGRIADCSPAEPFGGEPQAWITPKKQFTAELTDERNTLERALLHFAHFEKRAERLEENRYRLTVFYDCADETELLIRVLSFGPFLHVTEPAAFVGLLKERLRQQQKLGLR